MRWMWVIQISGLSDAFIVKLPIDCREMILVFLVVIVNNVSKSIQTKMENLSQDVQSLSNQTTYALSQHAN